MLSFLFYHRKKQKDGRGVHATPGRQAGKPAPGPHTHVGAPPAPSVVQKPQPGPQLRQRSRRLPFHVNVHYGYGAAQRKNVPFHLDSFHAHHDLQTDTPGLAVCSLLAKGRSREVAGRSCGRGLAFAIQRILGGNTNTCRRVALNPIPQDRNACTFSPSVREVKGRGKEGINLSSYKGKLKSFSCSKKLTFTILFLQPSHFY